MSSSQVAKSKFLSLVLRHKPEAIDLSLDAEGWATIEDLLSRAGAHGMQMTRQELEHIVATSDKSRFAISSDGLKIRANQGHSVSVDLQLKPQVPPEILYHGTVVRFLPSIRAQGLIKGQRHHVHLSLERKTAQAVGSRRGEAVILEIRSGEMGRADHKFFCSENGVWLTDHVPTTFIDFPSRPT